jgi:hypothetical protein
MNLRPFSFAQTADETVPGSERQQVHVSAPFDPEVQPDWRHGRANFGFPALVSLAALFGIWFGRTGGA